MEILVNVFCLLALGIALLCAMTVRQYFRIEDLEQEVSDLKLSINNHKKKHEGNL